MDTESTTTTPVPSKRKSPSPSKAAKATASKRQKTTPQITNFFVKKDPQPAQLPAASTTATATAPSTPSSVPASLASLALPTATATDPATSPSKSNQVPPKNDHSNPFLDPCPLANPVESAPENAHDEQMAEAESKNAIPFTSAATSPARPIPPTDPPPVIAVTTEPESTAPFTSTLVQIVKGKVVFKEKKLNLDKQRVTIAELNAFHEYKDSLATTSSDNMTVESDKNEPTLFPVQFHPLVAKYVQDSDISLAGLTKHIMAQLFPDTDDDDDDNDGDDENADNDDRDKTTKKYPVDLTPQTLSATITRLATRVNYGLFPETHPPASCSIWRWNVHDQSLLGSQETQEKVAQRKSVREQVAKDLGLLYAGLSETEREGVMGKAWWNKYGRKSSAAAAAASVTVVVAATPATPVANVAVSNVVVGPVTATPVVMSEKDGEHEAATPAAGSTKKTPAGRKKEKDAEKIAAAAKAKEEAREKKEQEKREAKEAKERKKEEERAAAEKIKEEARLKKLEEKKEAAKKDEKKTDKGQMSMFSFVKKIAKPDPAVELKAESTEDASLIAFRKLFLPYHTKAGSTLAQHNRFWHQTPSTFIEEIAAQTSETQHSTEFTTFLKTASSFYRSTLLTKRIDQRRRNRIKHETLLASRDPTLLPDDEEEDPYKKFRNKKWKLLQFAEDYRPPYFGTWLKRSRFVRGVTPWRKEVDTAVVNYEVDSEDEWEEEEEPGEELGSEIDEDEDHRGEKVGKGEERDEGEEMDDWMVPDGYLSEDEAGMEDEDGVFRKERSVKEMPKKKVGPLVPVVVCWFEDDASPPQDSVLNSYHAVWMIDDASIDPFTYRHKSALSLSDVSFTPHKHASYFGNGTTSVTKALKTSHEKHSFEEQHMEPLVRLVVGNTLPLSRLVEYVKESFPLISKVQLELKIRQVAEKRKVVGSDKQQWVIKQDFEKHCLPGTNPQILIEPARSSSPVAIREVDPSMKRKAASKPAIVDPDTSPLPQSPRHFVIPSHGEYVGDDDEQIEEIVGDLFFDGDELAGDCVDDLEIIEGVDGGVEDVGVIDAEIGLGVGLVRVDDAEMEEAV